MKYIFVYYDRKDKLYLDTIDCQSDSEVKNIVNSLYNKNMSNVEYARIDNDNSYWAEYQFDVAEASINVLDDGIIIARIKPCNKYIVEIYDGTTVGFYSLQKAIAFASIYDYFSDDGDDMPW